MRRRTCLAANPRGAEALAARRTSTRVIGDAYAPRDVEAAILEGWDVGLAC
jgi:hypothetical protein